MKLTGKEIGRRIGVLIARLQRSENGKPNLSAFARDMAEENTMPQPTVWRIVNGRVEDPDDESRIKLARELRRIGASAEDVAFLSVQLTASEAPPLTDQETELLIRFRGLPDVLKRQTMFYVEGQAALAMACPALKKPGTLKEYNAYFSYEKGVASAQKKRPKTTKH